MPSTLQPAPRQQFRDTPRILFGRLGSEWGGQEIFVGADDLWYARGVRASDLTKRETVAVLGDRRRFLPLW